MPAAVQVMMVAVDEESAIRMAQGGQAPDVLGKSGAAFNAPARFREDLIKLKAYLNSQKYNYRIFSSHVFLPANDA
jgi:uncharacterized protein (TIGR02599 family)